jgi:hypothetical protein
MGNFNLLIDSSQEPTREQLQYLRDLPAQHKFMIMDAIEDPVKKARMVVMVQGGHMISLPEPTGEQITLAYQDCYNDIVKGDVDENCIDSIRQAILSYPTSEYHNYGKKEGVEQLLSLASRMIKGERCGECEISFRSPTRGSDDLHRELSRAIRHIVGDTRMGSSLSLKSKFALKKLCSIYPSYYRPLEEYLIGNTNPRSAIYEKMWCHENVHLIGGHGKDDKGEHKMICKCWDEGYEGAHCKTCYWGEQGEGYSHVKQ